MTTKTLPGAQTAIEEGEFQSGEILTIVTGHFVHDIYTAMVPTLLPKIIEKLSLTLTAASVLPAITQLPSLMNPFIGYLADKVSLRYFVIFAPAATAMLISALGLASSYTTLLVLLLATGVSIAAFHAPAPAMIGRISGGQIGRGMSYFMASGELARSVGPLLAVWAVSTWTLEGSYRVVVFGWLASALLYWQLRKIPARPEQRGNLKALLPYMKRVMFPVWTIVFFRNFLNVSLNTFLPTYMDQQGAEFWLAGAALSILEFAGVAGAFAGGIFSDRLGRRPVLAVAIGASAALSLVFLNVSGWLLFPVLIALGFVALSTTPVLLAIVQEQMPDFRAVGNGLFLAVTFLGNTLATLLIGFAGDHWGLHLTFTGAALISLVALPVIWLVPTERPNN